MSKDLTRRGFLKGTAATAGACALAGAGGMTAASTWLGPAKAEAQSDERVVYTYHQAHCRGNCTLACTVRDGRVCAIQPNDAAGEGFRKICVKGLSEIQHIYSTERIQTPLKRVGERGSGEFVSISWDEAMDILVENVQGVWDKYGKKALFFWAPTENTQDVAELPKLLGATVGGLNGVDIGYANGLWELYGNDGKSSQACVRGSLDIRDLVNTRTYICVGSNFVESGLPHCSAFFDGKEAGMYSVMVDPIFTASAGKCDQWVPIEAGTDPAFFLGLVSAVLENEWYDEEFVKAHTTFPFLVSEADGALLRDHAVVLDEEGADAEGADANPFKVLGTDGQVHNAEECEDIALIGNVVVDGVAYHTVFSQLLENAKSHSLSWAAETTGIDEQVLLDLADRYANHGPSRIDVGYGGGDRFQNVDIAGHAAGILASLTGNFGKYGSGIGVIYNAGYDFGDLLAAWELPKEMKSTKLKEPMFDLPYMEDSGIHALITWGDLQPRFADLTSLQEWLKTLDFVCAADVVNITTTDYADLVLPICTRFECDEEIGAAKTARWHVALREKCIDPLFDSRTDFQAMRTIAEAFGVADALPATALERVTYQVENSDSAKLKGMTIGEIRSNQNVLPYRDFYDERKPKFADGKFPGSSNRLDVYYSSLVDYGQALPVYEGPNDAKEENLNYPLRFLSVKSRFRLHDQFCDSTWNRQFCKTVLEMNPIDMTARGLEDGDEVAVYNDRGDCGCQVAASESVRPGTVKILQNEWTKYMTFGNQQNLTNPTVTERGLALPNGPVLMFNDVLVDVVKA